MVRLWAAAWLLIAVASSFSVPFRRNCGGGEVKDVTQAAGPTPTTHTGSMGYPCREDWDKICTVDSDCCSGVCRKPFCKILGIDDETGKKGKKKKTKKGVKGKRRTVNYKVLDSTLIA